MNSDITVQTERVVLGGLMQDNSQWSHAKALSTSDFLLSSHSLIFGCINVMLENGTPVDSTSLTQELDKIGKLKSIGDTAYLVDLLRDGEAVPNIAHHVKELKNASTTRQWKNHIATLGRMSPATATTQLATMQEFCNGTAATQTDWRSLFHTREEIQNAPPLRFAIDGFLQEEGVTMIGGLAGNGKTLMMLAMVQALLTGQKLFGKFQVTRISKRVLYLIPECGIGPFVNRLKLFRLEDHIGDRLFIQTLSSKQPLSITDPRLLTAAEGADVFLDTAVRFMEGDENDASEQRAFAQALFNLQRAGALTESGAHHSPKNFSKDNYMTLENVLRGSGDIGAMLCAAWGIRQIDATSNKIFVQNLKARDFDPCEPFIIQGRPSLDEIGQFDMPSPPGHAGQLSQYLESKGGRAEDPDKPKKIAEIRRLQAQGWGAERIAKQVGISKGTVSKWCPLKESGIQ